LTVSGADVQAWIDGEQGRGNIALSLRDDVIGIDVDAYAGKDGGQSLAELTARAGGPLPHTWVSTSRADGVSGIRFYRATCPAGRVWIDQPGGTGRGIEAIHRGHRYAVVWPSVHPNGQTYVWHVTDPGLTDFPVSGPLTAGPGCWLAMDGAPAVVGLPRLPAAWVEVLSRPGEVAEGSAAGHAETLAQVDRWPTDDVECGPVRAAINHASASMLRADREALHPTANASVWSLVCLAHEGHRGAREALATHYALFLRARGDVRGEGREKAAREWWRMVRGAVGKAMVRYPGGPAPVCPCLSMLFDPGVAPAAQEATSVDTLRRDVAGQVNVTSNVTGVTPAFGAPAMALDEERPAAAVEVPDEGPVSDPERPPSLRDRVLDLAGLRKLRRPAPLIKGVLHLDSESWLIGPPGGFKSFVALDWACHVATGQAWRGRRTHGGGVLYVVAEGVAGFRARVDAWALSHGVEPDRLSVLPVAVQANGGTMYGMPQLGQQWYELCAIAAEDRPALVVLDTQARMTVGLEENSATSMGLWVAAVGMLRQASGACVLVVHHTGRDGRDARGSSALDGAQDMEWKVSRIGDDGKTLKAKLRCDKSKDASDDLSFTFDMRVIEVGVDDDGDPVTSLVLGDDVSVDESSGIGAVKAIEREASWLSNAQWIAGVLELMAPDEAGLTIAECRRMVQEAQRRGGVEVMTESVFRATVWREVKSGRLIKPTPARVALAEPPETEVSAAGAFMESLVRQCGDLSDNVEQA
jgi:hypothetical protein